jgi:chemotaxis family two-component system response regulator Rcp1
VHILLVEDNEDHALLTERAVRSSQSELSDEIAITTVGDGSEALGFLHAEGPYAQRKLPDLILLDLKMPGMDGMDVLANIRADPHLRLIPVIVLTTSLHDEDVMMAYNIGANEYVVKPVKADEFRRKVQAIPVHWSQVVQRPPRLLN